ncbi:MAG: permease [Planctomycetes bacterium]|nr:permease [Planctomycetota bacterium]
MLDNIAGLVLAVGLLSGVYGFPADFVLGHMIPGTALGVLIGDLAFTILAFRLARQTGRSDVTAMPLGLDTPSTIGMIFFVLGPAFLAGQKQFASAGPGAVEMAARYAWHIGIWSLLFSGVLKVAASGVSGWIRRVVPRAGLLGSLAAIALVLISFLPFLDVAHVPVVGFISLAIILTTLVARVPLPGKLPGALGATLVGGVIYFAMYLCGAIEPSPAAVPTAVWLPTGWLEALRFGWVGEFKAALIYLPVVIPFALATIIGGIDCTESAAAAGDAYSTREIIFVEGLATLLAGCFGGVIQTTPYIGHPAYKAMGGRAAYTLATALVIGSAGILGYFGSLYAIIPKPVVYPILIFIGLEITAQSYLATPRRHYAAVALACLPALAYLIMLFVDQVLASTGSSIEKLVPLPGPLGEQLQTLRVLSAGFILTSLLWGAMLASIIDRKLHSAAAYCGAAALLSLFGIIHSPLKGSPLVLPWDNFETHTAGRTPLTMAAAYAAVAILLCAWSRLGVGDCKISDEH